MFPRVIRSLRRRWRDRILPRTGVHIIRRMDLDWELDLSRWIDREFAVNGVFEPATTTIFRRMVRPGMTVIDVGGNFGYFSLLAAQAVGPNGRVISFEPLPWMCERLQRNLRANGFSARSTAFPIALSDTAGTSHIHHDLVSATLHPTGPSSAMHRESIVTDRLDDVAREHRLPPPQIIKIDVDGHEPKVLAGGLDYLRHSTPVMVIEFASWCLREAGSDPHRLREQICDMGYVLYSERTGLPFIGDADFTSECCRTDRSANVWAIPARLSRNGAPLSALSPPLPEREP